MPRLAHLLLVCLGCQLCSAADLGDAAVLAQSTLHLRRLQAEQVPYYPQAPGQQLPFPPMPQPQQQPPYYAPMPPQQPYYAPMPGQQMPVYPSQQAPYPGQPQQGSYYPGPPPQAPYYPGQPQQAPYFPGQPQSAPYYPAQVGVPPQPQPVPGMPQAPAAPQAQPAPPQQAPDQPAAQWQGGQYPQSAVLSYQQMPLQQGAYQQPPMQQSAHQQAPMQQRGGHTHAIMNSIMMQPIVPTLNDTVELRRVKRTQWERHPRTYGLFRLVPSTKTHCLHGQKDYMLVVQERLRNSPLSMQYSNTSLEEGSCSEGSTFNKGPDYHKCFPQATLYHPFAQNREQVFLKEISATLFGSTQEQRVAVQKSWKAYTAEHSREEIREAELEIEAMCDNGRMMEETFGLPIAALSFNIMPASGDYCVQGSKSYLQTVLGHLNMTDEFRDTEVEEGACLLRSYGAGPNAPRCLSHASLYFSDADRTEERLADAHEQLGLVCENATLGQNVSSVLRTKQEKANLRALRLKEDAEEQAQSNFYMFDEKLYSCWQGPKQRLEKVRDYFRNYGMPEWFFEQRMKIYGGSCDNMCMINGWVERRSCIRHVRQCRHPDIDEIDPFLHKKDTLVMILKNGTRDAVDKMIEGADLEASCGPQTVLRRKQKKPSIWSIFNDQIQQALYGHDSNHPNGTQASPRKPEGERVPLQ